MLVRYVYAAGNRDFFLLESFQEFKDLLASCKNADSVIAMKSFRPILEGVVDNRFLAQALAAYEQGGYWLLIGPDIFPHTPDWAFGQSADEVQEELETRLGNRVCIVEEPDWFDETQTIGGFVPNSEGKIQLGAY